MCLIVDNSVSGKFFSSREGELYFLALDWITEGNGKLVMGGRLWDEYQDVPRGKRILTRRAKLVLELERQGRARFYSAATVDEEERRVKDVCQSNDAHVIALARISGARVLCARDGALEADFKNLELINSPAGHIYETAADSEHLDPLHGHGCPYPPPAR